MGDPNASIPTPQPVHYRPMFGAFGAGPRTNSLIFASKASVEAGIQGRYGLGKQVVAVENTRGGISKASMIHNGATPKLEIDPETYIVKADGEVLTCEPATELPMAQRYFLF
jgi:urease subunit alpha